MPRGSLRLSQPAPAPVESLRQFVPPLLFTDHGGEDEGEEGVGLGVGQAWG